MRGIYIFQGNLLMIVAVVIALLFGGGQVVNSLLDGKSIDIDIMDFLFPFALFITGFFLQYCSLAKRIALPIFEELLLAGTLFLYIRDSLAGGFTWWLTPLRDYIPSSLAFTIIGYLLPGVIVFVMAALIVLMIIVSGEKEEE